MHKLREHYKQFAGLLGCAHWFCLPPQRQFSVHVQRRLRAKQATQTTRSRSRPLEHIQVISALMIVRCCLKIRRESEFSTTLAFQWRAVEILDWEGLTGFSSATATLTTSGTGN